MCGIVGYIGTRNATPFILDGLQRLEYRGYNSAGIAIANAGRHRPAPRRRQAEQSARQTGTRTDQRVRSASVTPAGRLTAHPPNTMLTPMSA